LGFSVSSNATLISTTTQATFNTAISGLASATETFSSATPDVISQAGQEFSGFNVSWVNGSDSDMAVYVADNTFGGAHFHLLLLLNT